MVDKPDPYADLEVVTKLSRLYEALSLLYRRTGESAKAENMKARRLELWLHWDQKVANNAFVRRQLDAASRT